MIEPTLIPNNNDNTDSIVVVNPANSNLTINANGVVIDIPPNESEDNVVALPPRQFGENTKPQGSFALSLVCITLLAHSTRGALATINPPAASMTELSQTLKSLLAIAPLLPMMTMPIPITWAIHKNGGKTEVLLMVGGALGGMILISTIAGLTDLSTIKQFDGRYVALWLSSLLTGLGNAAYYPTVDTFKWGTDELSISRMRSIYTFIVDSAFITTPIITYYTKTNQGYLPPYILYTSMVLISGIINLIWYQPSPYVQFRRHFSYRNARELAIDNGQLDSLIGFQDRLSFSTVFVDNLSALGDRRILLLCFTFLASLGSSWFNRLILPNVLIKGYGFGEEESIIVSALAYIPALISRPLTNYMLSTWDIKSGGIRIYLLGCVVTISSALALTNILPRWGLYTSLGLFNYGCTAISITALDIAVKWRASEHESLHDYNPGAMFSLFGTIGTFGSILLPLFLGLMVDQTGAKAYHDFYFIIVVMMLVSAVGVPIVDAQVKNKSLSTLFFSRPFTFFAGGNQLAMNPPPPNANPPQAATPPTPIYPGKFI